ncbi:hypothetical protein QQP08_013753 [Theobroma cacao]|nr:hypothetical protein QQP08_013753 [Theobroma cacao]
MCQALALTAVLALIWRRFGCPVSCEIFQFLSVPFQSCFLQENGYLRFKPIELESRNKLCLYVE